jgi:hypothetical protein
MQVEQIADRIETSLLIAVNHGYGLGSWSHFGTPLFSGSALRITPVPVIICGVVSAWRAVGAASPNPSL